MSVTKRPGNKKSPEPVKTKVVNDIPQSTLNAFINEQAGEVKGLFKTDCINLFDNYYRINVWTKQHSENLCPKVNIAHSFYVRYHEGLIIDQTIYNGEDNDSSY